MLELVELIMLTMDRILEQVFAIASNPRLEEWGIKTIEKIADKVASDMPDI